MDRQYFIKIQKFLKKDGFTPLFKKRAGFTLIEILVVISISAFIMISLLTNVLRTRVNLAETARIVIADIRTAQANALSSKQFQSTPRCGYGIHLLTSQEASAANLLPNSSYYLYVSKTSNCGNNSYNPADSDVVLNRVVDSRLQFCSNPANDGCNLASGNDPRFEDIFFQTPSAKTYVKNKTCPSSDYSQIVVRKTNAACPSSDCIYICVYPTGKIESRSSICPTSTNC